MLVLVEHAELHCTLDAIALHPGLQPYVSQAATLSLPGCNPTYRRLQPYASQAATLRIPGCNPTHRRLQPYPGTLDAIALTLRPQLVLLPP